MAPSFPLSLWDPLEGSNSFLTGPLNVFVGPGAFGQRFAAASMFVSCVLGREVPVLYNGLNLI